MINLRKFDQLLHDLKRISKIIPIIRDEVEKSKRELIAGLLLDEMDRLLEDISEEKEEKGG